MVEFLSPLILSLQNIYAFLSYYLSLCTIQLMLLAQFLAPYLGVIFTLFILLYIFVTLIETGAEAEQKILPYFLQIFNLTNLFKNITLSTHIRQALEQSANASSNSQSIQTSINMQCLDINTNDVSNLRYVLRYKASSYLSCMILGYKIVLWFIIFCFFPHSTTVTMFLSLAMLSNFCVYYVAGIIKSRQLLCKHTLALGRNRSANINQINADISQINAFSYHTNILYFFVSILPTIPLIAIIPVTSFIGIFYMSWIVCSLLVALVNIAPSFTIISQQFDTYQNSIEQINTTLSKVIKPLKDLLVSFLSLMHFDCYRVMEWNLYHTYKVKKDIIPHLRARAELDKTSFPKYPSTDRNNNESQINDSIRNLASYLKDNITLTADRAVPDLNATEEEMNAAKPLPF